MSTDEIRAIPLFRTASRSRRAELARLADRITVPAGQVLARQGALAHEFFVIIDGIVDVIRDGEVVAVLGPWLTSSARSRSAAIRAARRRSSLPRRST